MYFKKIKIIENNIKCNNLFHEFPRKYENLTHPQLMDLFKLTLYYRVRTNAPPIDFTTLDTILKNNNYSQDHFMQEITPDCEDMFKMCMWKGAYTRCDALFQKIRTSEGVCCSFNFYAIQLNNYPR